MHDKNVHSKIGPKYKTVNTLWAEGKQICAYHSLQKILWNLQTGSYFWPLVLPYKGKTLFLNRILTDMNLFSKTKPNLPVTV